MWTFNFYNFTRAQNTGFTINKRKINNWVTFELKHWPSFASTNLSNSEQT